MEIFDRKTEGLFSPHAKIMGYALGLGGLLALFQYPIFGLILIAFSIFILKGYKGFALNFDELIYKEYWGALGLKFGTWKNLPPLKRISLVNQRTLYRNESYRTGLSTYSNEFKTSLNLRINDVEYLCAAKGSYEQMITDALLLSKHLELDILDATKEERKTISKEVGNFVG